MTTKRKLTNQALEQLDKIHPQTAEMFSMASTRGCGTRNSPMTWEEYLEYKRSGEPRDGDSGLIYYYDDSGNLRSEAVTSMTVSIDEIDVVGNSNWHYGLSFADRTWISMYYGITGNMGYIDTRPPTGSMDGSQGGGGSSVGEKYFKSVELMNSSKFVPYGTLKDCMTGAKAIMSNYGLVPDLSRRVEFVTANGVASLAVVAKATKIADDCFKNNQPFIAGVRTVPGKDENVGQYANHFVVITGRGTNNGVNYFTYMETGVSDFSLACDTYENRFYYNESTKRWEDEKLSYGDNKMGYITEFRPNK